METAFVPIGQNGEIPSGPERQSAGLILAGKQSTFAARLP
jgi:hypothetical protein